MSSAGQAPIDIALNALVTARDEATQRGDQRVERLAAGHASTTFLLTEIPELEKDVHLSRALRSMLERMDPGGARRGHTPSVYAAQVAPSEDRSGWDRFTVLAHAVKSAKDVGADSTAALAAVDTVHMAIALAADPAGVDVIPEDRIERAAKALHQHACDREREQGGTEGIDWVPWELLPEWAQARFRDQARVALEAGR